MSYSCLLLVGLACAAEPGEAAEVEADVLIEGATLYDGAGTPRVVGNVALRGDRIVAVGKCKAANKPRVISGKGLIVAPGFIDLHTHSDQPLTESATRANQCYLFQGVATVVTGNCGAGPTDVAGYFRKLEKNGIGSNVIHQVPQGDVRRQVMQNANRPPTTAELRRMEQLVDQGMKEGAWAMSTGLIYNPSAYAQTDELISLAKVVARHGGLYVSHIRDEGPGVLVALDEALRIGKEARLPVHISHLKASGRSAWGKVADEIALIETARRAGQVVSADQYPYVASSTRLAPQLIPARFREGSAKDFQDRVADPEQGKLIRTAITQALKECDGGKSIRIASYSHHPAWQGKDLAAIAAEQKQPVVELVLEIERHGGAQIVNFSMNEEEVRLIMRQPFVATASDGASMTPAAKTVPHPRSYGCFPRKIGRYAIADQVLPVEQAIRASSGLPADILKLPQRGYLKPGYFADVVVFDPKTFRDRATFDRPHQYATGVRYLFVNGKLAIEEGKYTGALAGRVLRHKSAAEK